MSAATDSDCAVPADGDNSATTSLVASVDDVLDVLAQWGECSKPTDVCDAGEARCTGDIDGDGTISGADLVGVIHAWRRQ